mmetsp:Transcript_81164/g.160922  ORF Transcript_81164/g.160922 Transcript_81164/m.160922 type:complete len:324 (-) Transcript_81164:79-1050(-)
MQSYTVAARSTSDAGLVCDTPMPPKHTPWARWVGIAMAAVIVFTGVVLLAHACNIPAAPARAADRTDSVVGLSTSKPLSDKKWDCLIGGCRVSDVLGRIGRLQSMSILHDTTWQDKRDFRVQEESSRAACKNSCLADARCTGIGWWKSLQCVSWLGGACDVKKDNGHVWLGSGTITCQIRDTASILGEWEPQFSVIAEQSVTLTEGRSNSGSVTLSATQEASIGVTPQVGVEGSARVSLSQSFTRAWSKDTQESFTIKLRPKKNEHYLWQWIYRVKNRRGLAVKIGTREYALTRSKLHKPKCLPGTAIAATGYQKCYSNESEI